MRWNLVCVDSLLFAFNTTIIITKINVVIIANIIVNIIEIIISSVQTTKQWRRPPDLWKLYSKWLADIYKLTH